MTILGGSFFKLRLKVLELGWRDQKTKLAVSIGLI
jgi:hypothetical protein